MKAFFKYHPTLPFATCLLLVVGLIASRSSLFLAQTYNNLGFIFFNQYLSAQTSSTLKITSAESFFLHSTNFKPYNNHSAWRGIGWVYSARDLEALAINAWQHTDDVFAEMLLWGQLAQSQGSYEEALTWYAKAAALNEMSLEPWYDSGLVYEEMQAWQSAVTAYKHGLSLDPNEIVGKSDLSFRIGRILSRELTPPDLLGARIHFDTAIAHDDFKKTSYRVETYFLDADAARLLGNSTQALLGYEKVLIVDPENYWAHAYIGVLYWQTQQELQSAETHLSMAIEIAPEQRWAYEQLLLVYEQSDSLIKAAALTRQMSAIFQ